MFPGCPTNGHDTTTMCHQYPLRLLICSFAGNVPSHFEHMGPSSASFQIITPKSSVICWTAATLMVVFVVCISINHLNTASPMSSYVVALSFFRCPLQAPQFTALWRLSLNFKIVDNVICGAPKQETSFFSFFCLPWTLHWSWTASCLLTKLFPHHLHREEC